MLSVGKNHVASPGTAGYHRAMFFYSSKFLVFLTDPGTVLLLLGCVGAWLLWTRWRRVGRWLVSVGVLFGLAMAIFPIGGWLYLFFENRFPVVHDLPDRVDGIVVLGGVVDQIVTQARGQVSINGAAERLIEFSALARRYPEAKLVFTGGSGIPFRQDVKEADVLEPLLDILGLEPGRVVFERNARNTHENAVLTHKLVDPKPEETWVLITSAFHMPRAYGSFRKIGWRVIPYPVDFNTRGDESFGLSFSLGSGMSGVRAALHELMGLTFYWLTGKTDDLFPAPDG